MPGHDPQDGAGVEHIENKAKKKNGSDQQKPPLKVIEGLKGRYDGALQDADRAIKKRMDERTWGGNPYGYLSRNA